MSRNVLEMLGRQQIGSVVNNVVDRAANGQLFQGRSNSAERREDGLREGAQRAQPRQEIRETKREAAGNVTQNETADQKYSRLLNKVIAAYATSGQASWESLNKSQRVNAIKVWNGLDNSNLNVKNISESEAGNLRWKIIDKALTKEEEKFFRAASREKHSQAKKDQGYPVGEVSTHVTAKPGLLIEKFKADMVVRDKSGEATHVASGKRITVLGKAEIYERHSDHISGNERIEILGIPVRRKGERTDVMQQTAFTVHTGKVQRSMTDIKPDEYQSGAGKSVVGTRPTSSDKSMGDAAANPQAVINHYYKLAGGRNVDFDKVQKHAAKMGQEDLAVFNKAVALRNRN